MQYAVASRLSHFLGNTRPDSELLTQAEQGDLLQPEVLRSETNRLLEGPASEQFINNFTDYWLSLKDIRRVNVGPAHFFPQ